MTIDEIIDELTELREQVGGSTEVLFASQPSWPFEYSIASVVATVLGEDGQDGPTVVHFAEGRQVGYLPGEVAIELGWREKRRHRED